MTQLLLSLFFLVLLSSPAAGQRLPNWDDGRHFLARAASGVGGGMSHIYGQASYKHKFKVFSLHYLLSSNLEGLGDSMSTTAAQIGPSVGLTYGGEMGHVALSAGIAPMFGHHPGPTRLEYDRERDQYIPHYGRQDYLVLAAPVTLQAYYNVSDFCGVGATYVQTFSSYKTYGAFMLSLSAGIFY
jgi:hypothetical protein